MMDRLYTWLETIYSVMIVYFKKRIQLEECHLEKKKKYKEQKSGQVVLYRESITLSMIYALDYHIITKGKSSS